VLEMVQRSIQEKEDSASCKKSEKRVNFQEFFYQKCKKTSKDSNKAQNGTKEERFWRRVK
jgi:hypothetical protein